MIRRLLPAILGFFLFCVYLEAATNGTPTRENPIAFNKAGTAVMTSISTSAWTKANSATSLISDRSGYRVTNPAVNASSVFLVCHQIAPTESTTVYTSELASGKSVTMPCGSDLNLYSVSSGTIAQSIAVWEFGQ